MEKYSFMPYGGKFKNYAIIHTENGIQTSMAITDLAEKADFITKACNQFSIDKYEQDHKQLESSCVVIEMYNSPKK